MTEDTLIIIVIVHLVLGFYAYYFTISHEIYSKTIPNIWNNIRLAFKLFVNFLLVIILLFIPYFNIIMAIFFSFWPIFLFQYYFKSVRSPSVSKLFKKYKSEEIEGIFTFVKGTRQKYKVILKIDPFETNNQEVFEVMLLEIVENKESKYRPYIKAILSKIHSVDSLKKAFLADHHINSEGKSSTRELIISRMQELEGLEADRFLLDIVSTDTEPIMLFDYVETKQAMYEIREWAVKRENHSDHDLGLVAYIDKHYKKKFK